MRALGVCASTSSGAPHRLTCLAHVGRLHGPERNTLLDAGNFQGACSVLPRG